LSANLSGILYQHTKKQQTVLLYVTTCLLPVLILFFAYHQFIKQEVIY